MRCNAPFSLSSPKRVVNNLERYNLTICYSYKINGWFSCVLTKSIFIVWGIKFRRIFMHPRAILTVYLSTDLSAHYGLEKVIS